MSMNCIQSSAGTKVSRIFDKKRTAYEAPKKLKKNSGGKKPPAFSFSHFKTNQ
jgi:hypothetical protein